MQKFELTDLSPRGCVIELEVGEVTKKYRLKKFSLMAQIWVREEWGSEKSFDEHMNPQSEINQSSGQKHYIQGLCRVLHYLLEDKSDFPNWEDFAEACGSGPTEIMNLSKAYMTVVGLSQPLADQVVADAKKKMNRTAKKSGGTK